MIKEYEKEFENKSIMITGGLGFIGSNLARRLVDLKPEKVVIVDSFIKGLGANVKNIEDVKDKLEIPNLESGGVDIRNSSKMGKLIQGVDYVFNLAGSVSHSGSKKDPLRDLELNLEAHVSFLETCRKYLERERKEPRLKIVYSGTRDQYGKVKEEFLPVNESQLVHHAADPQGINKHAAEFYHLWYRDFGLESVSLRKTNIYGPRHQMTESGQGVLNWFIRKAIDNEKIELWGGGKSLRDFNYVDDVVDALLMTMASNKTDGQIYNLGSYVRKSGRYEDNCENVKTIGEVARMVVKLAGSGFCEEIPYPEDKKSIEPGHFCSDATKIYQDIGWEPKTSLEDGLRKTIEFYKKNKKHYW